LFPCGKLSTSIEHHNKTAAAAAATPLIRIGAVAFRRSSTLESFQLSQNRGTTYLFVFTQFRTQNRCALLLELL